MSNIATTIEQSRHLLELGLDPASADMWWSNRFVYWTSTPMICVATEQNQLYTFKWCEEDIPAWSLSALLEVIPKECEPDIQKSLISGVYFAHWFADGKPYITDDHGNAVAAAYEMVCWLLEQGLIKKGGNQ